MTANAKKSTRKGKSSPPNSREGRRSGSPLVQHENPALDVSGDSKSVSSDGASSPKRARADDIHHQFKYE
ncbi:unnamed protein product [Notodromas monacha]|uniref:Uncharacterized protein n=1 Tax=Notodromas monacha TaxID=399045 RepID=A0A7R9BNG6_9CRUS|nr:unnamed protein product [Notodromas monacha]CAG0918423.1 unnamed protein product [Notodromas monacha]